MTALNPITKAGAGAKMGSMQMLLLTAMTLLGFYLCFKEIKRMTMEMASLRDRVEGGAAKKRSPARSPSPADAPEPEGDEDIDGMVMVMDEPDDAMDEGLRQMLEHLQAHAARGAAPPPAEIEELDEEPSLPPRVGEDGPLEGLAGKTKAEIEELLRENGVPFKKSDAKAKLLEALVDAMGAPGRVKGADVTPPTPGADRDGTI